MSTVRNHTLAEEIDDIYSHVMNTPKLIASDELSDLAPLEPTERRVSSLWGIDSSKKNCLHLGEIDETEVSLSSDDEEDASEEDIDFHAKELASLFENRFVEEQGSSFLLKRDPVVLEQEGTNRRSTQPNDIHNRRSLSSRLVSSLRASMQKEEPLKRGSQFVSQSASRVRLSLR